LVIILKKIAYVLVIVVLNVYICSYLGSKLSARMEMRRGYGSARTGGIGFPAIRLFSYTARRKNADVWTLILFVFSLLIWSIAPLSSGLFLIDIDSTLVLAYIFYLAVLMADFSSQVKTGYAIVYGQMVKRIVSIISLSTPFFLSAASMVLVNRTLNLREIVNYQHEYWNIIYQPLGFIITIFSTVIILKILRLNRRGTLQIKGMDSMEGSGFSNIIHKFSGYSLILFMIYMIALLYLGGYRNMYFIRGEVMLGIKFYVLFFVILFCEKAVGSNLSGPGLLMRINGKFLIPMSIINFVATMGFFIYRNIFGLT
jgi:NADH-quinone oxidoreductase subunit H